MEFDLSKHIVWPNYEALKVLIDELKDSALKEELASAYRSFQHHEELGKAVEYSDCAHFEGQKLPLTNEDQNFSESSSCTSVRSTNSPTRFRSLSPLFFSPISEASINQRSQLVFDNNNYTNTPTCSYYNNDAHTYYVPPYIPPHSPCTSSHLSEGSIR